MRTATQMSRSTHADLFYGTALPKSRSQEGLIATHDILRSPNEQHRARDGSKAGHEGGGAKCTEAGEFAWAPHFLISGPSHRGQKKEEEEEERGHTGVIHMVRFSSLYYRIPNPRRTTVEVRSERLVKRLP